MVRFLLRKWLLIVFLLPLSLTFAQTVIIPPTNPSGTGNTTIGRKPYGSFWGYERMAAIYTAAEIGIPGTITSIGFFVNSTSSPAAVTPVRIYLKETSAIDFPAATTYASELSGATLVFDGDVLDSELIPNDWIIKTLSTPFVYSGSQNLMVLVETNAGGTGSEGSTAKQFRYSTAGSNSFQYWQADNTPPAGTGVRSNLRTNIQLNLTGATPCSGTPNPGTASAPASVCSGAGFAVTLSGYTTGVSGISIQWQTSTDGINFTNKPFNSNVPTTPDTITVPTYYRAVVICSGGDSAISNVVFVGLNPPTACYCTPTFTSGCNLNDLINEFSINTLVNSNSGCNNGNGNGYTVFPPSQYTTTLVEGATYVVSLTSGSGSGTHGAGLWIDFNQNGSFADPGEFFLISNSIAANTTVTTNITIPPGITPGSTRLRVRYIWNVSVSQANACTSHSWGEAEDYTVTLAGPVTCVNPPSAPVIIANPSLVCSGATSNLVATSYDLGTALQWQISSDSLTWSDVPGATNPTLVSQPITAPTFYRLKSTCSDSALSNVVKLTTKLCYCASNATNSGDTKIDSVFLNTLVAGSPLTTCETYTDNTNLSTTLQRLTQYPIVIKNGFCGSTHYAAYVSVYIDWNQDGDFLDVDETVYTFGPTTGQATIPAGIVDVPGTALLGPTTMRVVLREGTSAPPSCGTYTYGETEDYTVIVAPAPTCTTPTVGGTISGPDSADANTVAVFVLSGYTGDFLSWEISNNPAGPYIPLGVNDDTLTLLLNAVGTFYGRVKVSSPGCTPSYSDTFQIVVTLRGDHPCDAITVNIGKNGPYSIGLYTASPNEVRPRSGACQAQGVWCQLAVTKSIWFKFQAPASGRVYLYSPGFDTQLALWDADDCASLADSTLGGYTLLGANDDNPNYLDMGARQFSSFIDTVECLVPGKFYYVQLDPYSTSPTFNDTTSLFIIEAPAKDPSFTGLAQSVYCEDGGVETLFPATPGGVFSGPGIQNVNEFNPALAGVGGPYVISYTLNGCYTFRDTVSISAIPDIANVFIQNVKCFGEQTGSVAIEMNAGTPPFAFEWNTGSTDSVLTNVGVGQYQATITSADGCSVQSGQYTVTQPSAALSATTSSVNAKCFGSSTGSASVSAQGGTPGYTYSWSNAATTDTITGLSANIYTVTVTDANNCTVSVQAVVSQPSQITVVTTKQNVSCHGGSNGSISATANGGTGTLVYNWSNGAPNTASQITGLTAGVYSLTVADNNNCTASVTDTITQPSAIDITISKTNVACHGDSTGSLTATATGGTPNYTFTWTGNVTGATLSNRPAGVYSVTVQDANGCTKTKQDTIKQPNSPLSATSVSTDQIGSTNGTINVTVTGGTPNYSFAWSNNATTQNISAPAGVYTVTITDANNCTFVLKDTINFISGVEGMLSGVKRISLYPNPSNGSTHLLVQLDSEYPVSVEVFDALGKLMLQQELGWIRKEEIAVLHLHELASGLYNVRVKVGSHFYSKQLSIQK
jgi:hypothetical protein